MTMLVSLKEARDLALEKYFTGKPCIRGHIAERWVLGNHCVVCSKEISSAYRKRHPDRDRARTKRYKKAHPEWVKQCRKARYDRNPAHCMSFTKKWLDKHPGYQARSQKKWRLNNPEKAKASKHRRRARLADSAGHHTAADIRDIKKLQKNKCAICATKIVAYHLDHIVPLKRGGDNSRKNIQILCPTCNLRKSCRDPVDFMQSQGRLL